MEAEADGGGKGGGQVKQRTMLKDIGSAAEITALVKRLELSGKIGRRAALSAAEVEAELNRIRNDRMRRGME